MKTFKSILIAFLLNVISINGFAVTTQLASGNVSAAFYSAADGDIIELTTSGGAYSWTGYNSVTLQKSITIRAKDGLALRPVITFTSNCSPGAIYYSSIPGAFSLTLQGLEINGGGVQATLVQVNAAITSNASISIDNCKLKNFAVGTILNYAGSIMTNAPLLVSNTILESTGASLYNNNWASDCPTSISLNNCYFKGIFTNGVLNQQAYNAGGTITNTINHCTFDGNSAAELKLYNKVGGITTITNTIFANNSGTTVNVFGGSQGINADINVSNCGVYPASKSVNYPGFGTATKTTNPGIDINGYATLAPYTTLLLDGKPMGFYNKDQVYVSPSVYANPTTIAGLDYVVSTNGPSVAKSFEVSSNTLTTDVTVTPPTNFEISSSNEPFVSQASIIVSKNTNKTLWVHLKAGLIAGNYNNEMVNLTDGLSASATLDCSGSVVVASLSSPADETHARTVITGLGYVRGQTPTATLDFTVKAIGQAGAVVMVTCPTEYEMSKKADNFSVTGLTSLTYTMSSSLLEELVTIRMKHGVTLFPMQYIGQLIISSSLPGVSNYVLETNNTVTSGDFTVSSWLLDRLNAQVGATTTMIRPLTVTSDTPSPITITSTSNYEISTSAGGLFAASTPIVLSPVAGKIASTIYIRMKPNPSLSVGKYSGTLTLASTTTTQTIDCKSEVYDYIVPPVTPETTWRPLSIRMKEQFDLGQAGGEGEQIFHGFSRCLTQPNYIYASEDVMGTWRSTDGGTTWKHNQDKGLWLPFTTTIEVDPVDPNRVFVEVAPTSWYNDNNMYNIWGFKGIPNLGGVYRSTDGGANWEQVIQCSTKNFETCRRTRSLIAWSKPSQATSSTSPTRWYAAFDPVFAALAVPGVSNGQTGPGALYRSDAGGAAGTWVKVYDNPDVLTTAVVAHPTLPNVVYLCTSEGLKKSTDAGVTFVSDSHFAGDTVTNVLINPQNPNKIYVVVSNPLISGTQYPYGAGYARNGLWMSTDGGLNYTRSVHWYDGKENQAPKDGETTLNVVNAYMNPGFPDQIFWVNNLFALGMCSEISNDGGLTWSKMISPAPTYPGDNRTGIGSIYSSVLPDPSNQAGDAVANTVGMLFKIKNVTSNTPSLIQSSTGFLGYAWCPAMDGCNFHPTNPNLLMLNCNDVGPQTSNTKGDWFFHPDIKLDKWKTQMRTTGGGSLAGSYQSGNTGVVVATLGQYTQMQLMRSTNFGETWDTLTTVKPWISKVTNKPLVNPYLPTSVLWNVTTRQPYPVVEFDRESGYENWCYAGNRISKDAGLTWDSIKTFVRNTKHPEEWEGGGPAYPDTLRYPAPVGNLAYVVGSTAPSIRALVMDDSGHSHLFATDGQLTHIYRSDDHAATWYSCYDNPGGSLAHVDKTVPFAVNPKDPNIFFIMQPVPGTFDVVPPGAGDLRKVVYDPVTKTSSYTNLNVFAAIAPWVSSDALACTKIRYLAIDPVYPQYMYCSLAISGIPNTYRSLDGGLTWASISDNDGIACHEGTLMVNPHTRDLYRGSMGGTFIYPAPPAPLTTLFNTNVSSKIRLYVDKNEQSLTLFDGSADEKYSIYDITGKLIKQFMGNSTSINMLSSGVYILKCSQHQTQKFVKL